MFRLAVARDTAVWCVIALGVVAAGFVAGDAVANSNPTQRIVAPVSPVPPARPDELGHERGASLPDVRLDLSITSDRPELPTEAPSLADIAAAAMVATLPPPAPLHRAEPFRIVEPTPTGPLTDKWATLAAEIADDRTTLARCRADIAECTAAAKRLLAIVDAARAKTGRAKLGEINRAINLAVAYTSDEAQHGVTDRWSAPLATLAAGRGDCEDYAIAKYVALIEVGVTHDDLRLLIVRNTAAGNDHAVVAARHDGRWLVLDNRHLRMVEFSDTPLVPTFALSGRGVEQVMRAEARRVKLSARD